MRQGTRRPASLGLPYLQVFANITGSARGGQALVSVMAVLQIFGTVNWMATCARQIFAFARDRGLPFGSWIASVDAQGTYPCQCSHHRLGIRRATLPDFSRKHHGFERNHIADHACAVHDVHDLSRMLPPGAGSTGKTLCEDHGTSVVLAFHSTSSRSATASSSSSSSPGLWRFPSPPKTSIGRRSFS